MQIRAIGGINALDHEEAISRRHASKWIALYYTSPDFEGKHMCVTALSNIELTKADKLRFILT